MRQRHDPISVPTENAGARRAEGIARRVFRDYPGRLAVRLWDGRTVAFGQDPPDFTLVFHEPRSLRDVILFPNLLRLAEAYCEGRIDIEGDFYAALRLKDHLPALRLSARDKAAVLWRALLLAGVGKRPPMATVPARHMSPRDRVARAHSRARDRQAITFHYDVSDAFYRLWLDERMVYSCAYFEHRGDSLNQAQCQKLDHLCRKLRLKPGERLLDIGCGWGALVRWAAQHHGVDAHGITLSRNQYEHCRREIAAQGLQGRVTVEIKDYRDMRERAAYDKIVSVGMFEHVGLRNLPTYFATAQRLLKPGGLFLNHGITSDTEDWRKRVGMKFINRHVFPDGELDTVSNVQRTMEHSSFEILDVEALRPHYALTLRHWVRRLEHQRDEALKHVTEPVYRVWRLYMAACAQAFEDGDIGVYQILAAKRDKGLLAMPLTRRDWYSQPSNWPGKRRIWGSTCFGPMRSRSCSSA